MDRVTQNSQVQDPKMYTMINILIDVVKAKSHLLITIYHEPSILRFITIETFARK